MEEKLIAARVVPPGRVISRELEARDWTQQDLAEIMGRPPQVISEIIRGKKQITPETAIQLAEAFGTSSELWLNLETNYQLHLARQQTGSAEIARKSQLFSLAPVSEMVKRSWIPRADSIDDLEEEVCDFMGISSPQDKPALAANFRCVKERGPEINAQVAWVKRVEHLIAAQGVGDFVRARLAESMPELLSLSVRPEDLGRIPAMLLSLGVHFIIVPHLDRTYLDGAAFYLDHHPVVALTLRYDRTDAFWFTLTHEIAHIAAGHTGVYLDDFECVAEDDAEREANTLARDWLIDRQHFERFVRDTAPYFSKAAIERFAAEQGRHPGIVLGRLQYEKRVDFSHLRGLLVKVSPYLQEWIDDPKIKRFEVSYR